MKKIILTLLLSIFLIPGVYAEELPAVPIEGMGFANGCSNNLIKAEFGIASYANGNWLAITDTSTKTYPINNYFIPVESTTTYYFSSNLNSYGYIYEFDSSLNLIFSTQTWPNISFTTKSSTAYFSFGYYFTPDNLINGDYWFQLEKGSTFTEYVDYEECAIELPDEPVVADTTLDSFYSLYVSKLSVLYQYATENKFLLGAIGIILLFVVLELILNLFRKGGYR